MVAEIYIQMGRVFRQHPEELKGQMAQALMDGLDQVEEVEALAEGIWVLGMVYEGTA